MANELEVMGWDDIVGESVRGPSGYPARLLGEDLVGAQMNAQANPAFAAQIARIAASQRPVMQHRPLTKARNWTQPIPRTYIGANATVTIQIAPQCYFRAEKLIMADNCTLQGGTGFGTSLTAVSVGQKNQLPVGSGTSGGIPLYTLLNTVLGNGIEWDTCQPAVTIALSVTDLGVTSGGSTVSGAIFGKAVVS